MHGRAGHYWQQERVWRLSRAAGGCRWPWAICANLRGPCSVWQICPVHPSTPSLPGTPSSTQGDPAPAAPIPLPCWGGSAGSTPAASPGKTHRSRAPREHAGLEGGFCSNLGDLLQDQSQRRRLRAWGADSGFPSPSPIPLHLASCERRLQQLRRGGGSGEDVQSPGTLFFGQGWELEGSAKAGGAGSGREAGGSEGMLGARQTCRALGSGSWGDTEQPSRQPQSFSWF